MAEPPVLGRGDCAELLPYGGVPGADEDADLGGSVMLLPLLPAAVPAGNNMLLRQGSGIIKT